jgi:hypothetical protein
MKISCPRQIKKSSTKTRSSSPEDLSLSVRAKRSKPRHTRTVSAFDTKQRAGMR